MNEIYKCEENKYVSIIGFDADKIQRYVFATSKPIEIEGASKIVKKVDREIRNWIESIGLGKENVLYAHGGGGLIISPPSKADKVIEKLEKEFEKMSITATLTAEKFDVPVEEVQKNFTIIFKNLSEKLRSKKDEKVAFTSYGMLIPPYFRRCTSCGIYSATEYDGKYIDEEERKICSSCFNKREQFRQTAKREILTVEDIVKKNQEEDYLALIYADGHNVGSILETLSFQEFKEVPQKLYQITQQVLQETIDKLNLQDKCITPVVGGDDILLIIPARKSLLAVQNIIERFSKKISSHDKLKDISLDIGLVISDAHFPLRHLFEYVEALLKNAKTYAYRENVKYGFDWMVIKGGSPLNLSIQELRKIEYLREIKGIEYKLTRKPYQWEEFQKKILKPLQKLKQNKFPLSQLHIIREHLLEHPEVARLNIMYQIARIKTLKDKISTITASPDPSRWVSFFIEKIDSFGYATSFFDLMELYKIVEV